MNRPFSRFSLERGYSLRLLVDGCSYSLSFYEFILMRGREYVGEILFMLFRWLNMLYFYFGEQFFSFAYYIRKGLIIK